MFLFKLVPWSRNFERYKLGSDASTVRLSDDLVHGNVTLSLVDLLIAEGLTIAGALSLRMRSQTGKYDKSRGVGLRDG